MAWIEYHTALRDHWKISRLADKLKTPYTEALGLVSCLWLWAAENAQDGHLKQFTDEEVARAARWTGAVNGFRQYLIDCELVDQDGRLHQWERYGNRLLRESKERTEQWRKSQKIKNKKTKRVAHTAT